MADILATLEAQLEGMEDDSSTGSSSDDDDDDDDDETSSEEDDDSEDDEDEDSDEDEEDSSEEEEEEEEDSADSDIKSVEEQAPLTPVAIVPDVSPTGPTYSQRRLSKSRMDISAQLEQEKTRLEGSERSRAALDELREGALRRNNSMKSLSNSCNNNHATVTGSSGRTTELQIDAGTGKKVVTGIQDPDVISPRVRRRSLQGMQLQQLPPPQVPLELDGTEEEEKEEIEAEESRIRQEKEAEAQQKETEAAIKQEKERGRRKSADHVMGPQEIAASEEREKAVKESFARAQRRRTMDNAAVASVASEEDPDEAMAKAKQEEAEARQAFAKKRQNSKQKMQAKEKETSKRYQTAAAAANNNSNNNTADNEDEVSELSSTPSGGIMSTAKGLDTSDDNSDSGSSSGSDSSSDPAPSDTTGTNTNTNSSMSLNFSAGSLLDNNTKSNKNKNNKKPYKEVLSHKQNKSESDMETKSLSGILPKGLMNRSSRRRSSSNKNNSDSNINNEMDRSNKTTTSSRTLDYNSGHSIRSMPTLFPRRKSASHDGTQRGAGGSNHTSTFNKSFSTLSHIHAKLRVVQERDLQDEDDAADNTDRPYHHGRTPFGKKPKPKPKKKAENNNSIRVKYKFWLSREVVIVCVMLLAVGALMGVKLSRFAWRRSIRNNPDWKFQQVAKAALADTANQVQHISASLQQIATKLQAEVRANNQTWPFITNHDILFRQAVPILRKRNTPDKHIHSIILAPLVTPKNQREYEYFVEDTHYDQQRIARYRKVTTLLQWDPLLDHLDKPEAMFVPWQQISRKMNHPKTNGVVLRDWYFNIATGTGTGTQQKAMWSSIEQSNSSAVPKLLLRNTARRSTKKQVPYDYILQPVIDSVVVKKRLIRPSLEENHAVVVVAAQLQWDQILQQSLQSVLMDFLDGASTGAVATLEDLCSQITTRVNIPVMLAENQPATQDIFDSPFPATTGRIRVGHVMNLAANLSNRNSSGLATTECPAASSWKLQLTPTADLRQLLAVRDWELYEIVATWIVAFVYVSIAVLFTLREMKRKASMAAKDRQEQWEKEEVDPDDFCQIASVMVLGIAGWDEWMKDGSEESGRPASDVAPFVTTLLGALDLVAAKHKVVKIPSVGGTLVYASGGVDHLNHVVRFARECHGRLPEWKKKWCSTYGLSTEKLQFTGGLGSGSLTGMQSMVEGSTSYLSGETIRKAHTLEAESLPGRVYLSINVATLLRQLGKGDLVKVSDEYPGVTWLDFSSTSNIRRHMLRRGSTRGMKDKSSSNLSVKSLKTRLGARRGSQGESAPSSVNDSRSLGTLGLNKAGALKHMQKLRKSQDSPPPLDKMGEKRDQPPISEIDVSMNDFRSNEAPTAKPLDSASDLDLGYEPMDFNDDEEDDDEDYSDDDESDASLEQERQMVIEMAQQKQRLLDWTVDVLSRSLEEILSARTTHNSKKALGGVEDQLGKGSNILEQCKDIIQIPIYSKGELRERAAPGSVPMADAAANQLREYVTKIADSYHDHAFHNFEHAANVTASMRKLFNKLTGGDFATRPNSLMKDNSGRSLFSSISVGQNTAYGIKTDPLIKFSIIFCALIHDADHPGVSNQQLIAENSPMAVVYKQRSVAEQNSVEFAWSLLMRPEYVDLRATIYSNEKELRRFRQTLVNCIMATDLHDTELQTLRKARWAKAFADDNTAVASAQQHRGRRRADPPSLLQKKEAPQDKDPKPAPNSMLSALRHAATTGSSMLTSRPKNDINRKGTVVLEHLLQAADISHCMQNWKVFLKWNERLFDEFFEAYEAGRANVSPATTWYQGELDFFDTIVIPLATKLCSCGVFEEAGEELLENAIANREEWAIHGDEILRVYLDHYKESHVHHSPPLEVDTGNQDSNGELGDDSGDHGPPSRDDSGTGSLARFLGDVGGADQRRKGSLGNLSGGTGTLEEQSRAGGKMDISEEDAPPLEPGTANSSVAEPYSDDDVTAMDDFDIVFAVLDDCDNPDDFDSYILLTPSELRKRNQEERDKDGKSVGTAGMLNRERRRRMRRATSSASTKDGLGGGTRRRGSMARSSMHSRQTLFSTSEHPDDVSQRSVDSPSKRGSSRSRTAGAAP